MSTSTLVSILWIVLLVGTCLTVFKLLRTKLFRRYPWFFAYFIYRIPATLGLLLLSTKSRAYTYFWVATACLSWIFYILVVRELYGLVLERHRGIYTLGRWAMYFAVAVSLTLSILSLPKFAPSASFRSRMITYVLASDGGVTLSLAIFLILMLLLLSQYVVILSRNVVFHACLFAGYFFSSTIYTLLRKVFNVSPGPVFDIVLLGISSVCVLLWSFLLTRDGEKAREVLPLLTVEHENRILSQLDSINQTLLGAGKK